MCLHVGVCVYTYVYFKIAFFLLKSMQMSWICLEVQMTFPQGVMEKTSHQLQGSPLWVDLTFEISLKHAIPLWNTNTDYDNILVKKSNHIKLKTVCQLLCYFLTVFWSLGFTLVFAVTFKWHIKILTWIAFTENFQFLLPKASWPLSLCTRMTFL